MRSNRQPVTSPRRNRLRSDVAIAPAESVKPHASSTRDPQQKAIRVRLSDTVEQGNLGSVLCHSLKGAGRVLHAWGFAPASLHTPLKERKKRGEVTGLLYKRIQFRFE